MSNLLMHGSLGVALNRDAATQTSSYRCLGLIGQGQFGRVYCAIDRGTERFVALKRLDRLSTNQFLRELRFFLSVRHPNIVAISAIEYGRDGRCLVMEYCEAGTLRNLIETHRFGEANRLPIALGIKLVLDVLAGLEHAHAQDMVHCDIKPENILLSLTPTGWTAKISDFGIARSVQEQLSKAATCTGSPAYMAPERFYGQYSQSTDLYAVGILLYELLVGCRPFSGAPTELMNAHLNGAVEIPDRVPASLRAIVLTALEKLKARRFQSAAQMRAALQVALYQCRLQSFEVKDIVATGSVQLLCEEVLGDAAKHITIVESSPPSQSDRSTIVFLGDTHRLEARSYRLDDPRIRKVHRLQAISEPIQALVARPQGCFVQTDRSLYLASETGMQLMIRFYQRSQIAIDPRGRWMAVVTLTPDRQMQLLSVWKLPRPVLVRRPIVYESLPESLINLFALDSRHIAAFLRTQDEKTCLRFWNRRAQSIGAFNLPINLAQVIQTPQSFCFAATETGLAQALLLIQLKPFKLTRILLDFVPRFLAALPSGLAVSNGEGQLVFLDYTGQMLDRFIVPKHISAMAAYGDTSLLIATWHQNQGNLYRLNLVSSDPPNLVS